MLFEYIISIELIENPDRSASKATYRCRPFEFFLRWRLLCPVNNIQFTGKTWSLFFVADAKLLKINDFLFTTKMDNINLFKVSFKKGGLGE